MSRQRGDAVVIQIKEELKGVNLHALSDCSIFRVNGPLRKQNEKAYEPSTVAIGPYHHGKNDLSWMEDHKLRYFDLLLNRRNDSNNVAKYINAMRDLELKARKCYAEKLTNLDDSDKFVRMLILDGCFIIEFCRKFMFKHVRVTDSNYGIVQTGSIGNGVRRDLMLLENQLPFCVLEKLFDMTKGPKEEAYNLVQLILCTLRESLPTSEVLEDFPQPSAHKVDHLLSLIHKSWCFPSGKNVVNGGNMENQGKKMHFINCVTELREAGIKFDVAKEGVPLFDIKFKKGVLTIPRLIVTDETETLFRNLIAYEQCSGYKNSRHITSYMFFMDRLINSAKDVEKLRKKGIISNWLGDDETVSTLVNNLCNNVGLATSDFCYIGVFQEVSKHCGARRNIWLAKLIRSHFHSPWSIISFLAATVLIVLTLLQTIFSILSYYKET